jgi:hypothetical protein
LVYGMGLDVSWKASAGVNLVLIAAGSRRKFLSKTICARSSALEACTGLIGLQG